MYMNVTIPTWFICTKCGDTEKVDDFNGTFIPDGWFIQRDDKTWVVYCPCINEDEKEVPEVDGSGYTAGGTAWNPSTSTTTTWNPTAVTWTGLSYEYPPLRKPKTPAQEKADAILAEIEEEKAAQRERWIKWEETKHSKYMDPKCEQCVEEIERIKRELKEFGKGNGDEK